MENNKIVLPIFWFSKPDPKNYREILEKDKKRSRKKKSTESHKNKNNIQFNTKKFYKSVGTQWFLGEKYLKGVHE